MNEIDALRARVRALSDENANLKRLVAASRMLAVSPLPEKVIAAVEEIVFGMIGARELVVFDVDHGAQALRMIHVRGIDASSARLSEALPLLADVVSCGDTLVTSPGEGRVHGGLTAAVPLKVDGTVTGLVGIFRLTDCKTELDALDLELLEVVGSQAAIPLHTKAYRSQRPTVRLPRGVGHGGGSEGGESADEGCG
jgi:GAF domain-containing protein